MCTGQASEAPPLQSVSAGLSEAVLYTLAGVTANTNPATPLPCVKSSKAGPLSLGTADILGPIILSWGCPVLCRVVSSPPSLYPLDANSTPPKL